jgi:hypothetical protein
MAKFVPVFKSVKRAETKFSTNNPFGRDRESDVTQIRTLEFNEETRTIEVMCTDGRKRQCRIDRFNNDKLLQQLTQDLQVAYDTEADVVFVAAGGNDPNVWFYTIVIIA